MSTRLQGEKNCGSPRTSCAPSADILTYGAIYHCAFLRTAILKGRYVGDERALYLGAAVAVREDQGNEGEVQYRIRVSL
jgi:hypothetical protein